MGTPPLPQPLGDHPRLDRTLITDISSAITGLRIWWKISSTASGVILPVIASMDRNMLGGHLSNAAAWTWESPFFARQILQAAATSDGLASAIGSQPPLIRRSTASLVRWHGRPRTRDNHPQSVP